MKKFLALILTLAMALSVTACGGSDDTADDTADGEGSGTEETADYASMTDDELKAAITTVEGGKLTVATSPDFAPYEFYAIDENGDPQLAGFDMLCVCLNFGQTECSDISTFQMNLTHKITRFHALGFS